MNLSTPYIDLWSEVQSGGSESFGVKISVSHPIMEKMEKRDLPENVRNDIFNAGFTAMVAVKDAILLAQYQLDPDIEVLNSQNKKDLSALFTPSSIYVETVPNGYSTIPFYAARPWYVVTTHRGHIKVGWRKRVLNIDWSKSNVKATAHEMFPSEEVTKGEKYIHAWSMAKAQEYVNKILITE